MSLTLNWTKATDDVSAQSALQYEVRRSAANNLDTVANAEPLDRTMAVERPEVV